MFHEASWQQPASGREKGRSCLGKLLPPSETGDLEAAIHSFSFPPVFYTSLKLDTKMKFMGFDQRDTQLLCCENYYWHNFIYADNDILRILYEFWIKLKFSFIAVLRIFGVTISYGKCSLSQDFLAECNC